MTFNLHELAALDAAGALTPDEQRDFDLALASAPAATRAEVAALRDVAAALADCQAADDMPSPDLKARILASLGAASADAPPVPKGFSFRYGADDDWLPHPAPGIRMKVLALNRESGYATLLLDVSPGARLGPHHHSGAEECYVISGSLFACGRRIHAGDFHHADAGSDHGELWSDEGCRVLLVVPPEEGMPEPPR